MRDNQKMPKGNIPNFNQLTNQLKLELGGIKSLVNDFAQMVAVFAGNSPFLENPELKELRSLMDSEPTCDLEFLHKSVLVTRILNLELVGCMQKLQESLGQ